MEDLNVPIFAQAKIEYTNQLVDVLYPHMYDGVKSIYDESKVIYAKKTSTPILFLFRELLEKVPIWNSEIIESECSRIMNNSKCDWIDDLITAVFISHTKILTSIGPNNTFNKINVTIPKTTSFIHKSYINLARELWKNPYLFNESVPGHEYQRNCKEIENIIKQCVEGTIRQLLPIKEILREHLDTYEDNTRITSKADIKQLLKEELSELKNSIIQTNLSENDDPSEEDNHDEGQALDNITENEQSFNIVNEKDKEYKEDKEDNDDLHVQHNLSVESDLKEDNTFTDNLGNDIKVNNGLSDIASEVISQSSKEVFYADDDPSEEQINKQVNDIVVNDITIPVEDDGAINGGAIDDGTIENGAIKNNLDKDNNPVGTEPKYDNADIVSDTLGEEKNKDIKLSDMMKHMKDPVEVNVVKNTESPPNKGEINNHDVIAPIDDSSFGLNAIFGKPEVKETPPEVKETLPEVKETPPEVKETLPEVKETPPEVKSENNTDIKGDISSDPTSLFKKDESTESIETKVNEEKKDNKEKQVVQIDHDDLDETSSLANFFNDMKQVVEDKGIKVEESKNFSLFEDASEIG